MVLGQLTSLRKKARIMVADSCVLIGVADQQGILEEGEIFVQVRYDSFVLGQATADTESRKMSALFNKVMPKDKPLQTIVEGQALVTKNPCSHPGDVQKVTAVNRKEFHHLFNVVVFSTKGSRPD